MGISFLTQKTFCSQRKLNGLAMDKKKQQKQKNYPNGAEKIHLQTIEKHQTKF